MEERTQLPAKDRVYLWWSYCNAEKQFLYENLNSENCFGGPKLINKCSNWIFTFKY